MTRSCLLFVVAILTSAVAFTVSAQENTRDLSEERAPDFTAGLEITDAERQKIQFLLSGYEYFPSAGELKRVSPHAHAILFEIASDRDALPSLRLRAIDALGLLPKSEALASFFEDKLKTGELSTVYANHYINASMKVYREAALPWVSPLLNHVDLQTQMTAVHAIGRFGGLEGRQILNFHAQFTRDAILFESIDRALSR